MRYIVYGAGAVGGVIGGRLFQHGHDIVLVARGAHLDALRTRGLELQSPEGSEVLPIPAVPSPLDVEPRSGDVIILAVKSQDTPAALDALPAGHSSTPIVCAQNGVENERVVSRRHDRVYAMCVMLPATHLEPGVVQCNGAPLSGILDVGRFPGGVDDLAAQVAADLDSSGFSSRPDPAIMRSKYAKLLMNLGNALEASCGAEARTSGLFERLRAEGEAVLAAAGIDHASEAEDAERRGDLLRLRPVNGQRRGGGSTWQSLARGKSSVETDYLNGEIRLLGRLHGVATPVNDLVQQTAIAMARAGASPGSTAVADLLADLERWN